MGKGLPFTILLSEHPATPRDLAIRGKKHYLFVPVRHAQNQYLAHEARDPLGRKVDHGDDLFPDKRLRFVMRRELGTGLPGPDLRPKVHDELDGRLACLRERPGLDDRADAYIHLLEICPTDLRQCTVLWLEVSGYRLQVSAIDFENRSNLRCWRTPDTSRKLLTRVSLAVNVPVITRLVVAHGEYGRHKEGQMSEREERRRTQGVEYENVGEEYLEQRQLQKGAAGWGLLAGAGGGGGIFRGDGGGGIWGGGGG